MIQFKQQRGGGLTSYKLSVLRRNKFMIIQAAPAYILRAFQKTYLCFFILIRFKKEWY